MDLKVVMALKPTAVVVARLEMVSIIYYYWYLG